MTIKVKVQKPCIINTNFIIAPSVGADLFPSD